MHDSSRQNSCICSSLQRGEGGLLIAEGGWIETPCGQVSDTRIKEALPGVLGNRGNRAIISGEHGNKGQLLRETGEQRQYWGTGNIRKQIFDFWGTGEQANLFRGTRKQVSPPPPPPRGRASYSQGGVQCDRFATPLAY